MEKWEAFESENINFPSNEAIIWPESSDRAQHKMIARVFDKKNALVIAAAPELLAFAKQTLDLFEYNAQIEEIHGITSGNRKRLEYVKNLIAKAEGK